MVLKITPRTSFTEPSRKPSFIQKQRKPVREVIGKLCLCNIFSPTPAKVWLWFSHWTSTMKYSFLNMAVWNFRMSSSHFSIARNSAMNVIVDLPLWKYFCRIYFYFLFEKSQFYNKPLFYFLSYVLIFFSFYWKCCNNLWI